MTAKTLAAPETFPGRGVLYERREDGSYAILCGRCGGSGQLESYRYVEGGVCFKCNGHEGPLGSLTEAEANTRYANQVRYRDRKETKRLKIVAARDERVAALAAAEPEVAAVLQAQYDETERRVPFLVSLAEQLHFADGHALTEKQIEAVKRFLAQRAEEAENSAPVIEGRIVVIGEVVSIKRVFNDYGDAVKVTVKDDRGFKVYGTLAASLVQEFYDAWLVKITDEGYRVGDYGGDVWFETVTGQRVTFTATVKASADDGSFGFYSRPTKASRA